MVTTMKERSDPNHWKTVRWTVFVLALTGLGCSSNNGNDRADLTVLDVPGFEQITTDTPMGDLLDARVGELADVAVELMDVRDLDAESTDQETETNWETDAQDCVWSNCGAGGEFKCIDGKIRTAVIGHMPCWVVQDCFAHSPPIPCNSGECGTAGCSDDEAFLASLFPVDGEVRLGGLRYDENPELRVRLGSQGNEAMEFIGIQAQQMVLQDETTALYMWRYVDDNMTLKMNGSPVDADWVELYSILYPRHDEKPFRVWGCNGHLVAQLATGQEVAVSWRVPLSSAGNPHNCSSSSWSGEAAEFVVVWRDPEPPENEP